MARSAPATARAATAASRSFVIMRTGWARAGPPSSARGPNLPLQPRVETSGDGSTRVPMTRARRTPTVSGVNLRERPRLPDGRPGSGAPLALRVVGYVGLAAIFVSVLTIHPLPGVRGDGRLVTLGVVLLAAGIAGSLWRGELPRGARIAALLTATAGTCLLTAVQPRSAGAAGIYFVVVVAGMRLPGRLGVGIAGLALGAEVAVMAVTPGIREGSIAALS